MNKVFINSHKSSIAKTRIRKVLQDEDFVKNMKRHYFELKGYSH